MFTHKYQDFLDLDIFENFMSKLIQDIEYVKTIIHSDDLLILTNNSFKDHLLKLKMVPERLSNASMRIKLTLFLNLSSLQHKYNTLRLDNAWPDKVSHYYTVRLILSLKFLCPKLEKKKHLWHFLGHRQLLS
jgi:hypothetical protein